jgi:hypothetical protein
MNMILASTLAALLTSTALATVQPPEVAAAAPVPDRGRVEDPNVDHGFFLPTAETQPAGSVTVSNFDLVVFDLSVALTDRLQVGETAFMVMPFTETKLFLTHVKWQLWRSGGWRLSLLGGLGYVGGESYDGPAGERHVSELFPQIGAVASYCVGGDCSSMVSFGAHGFHTGGPSLDARVLHGMLVYGGSFTARLTSHIKMMAEVMSAGSVAADGAQLAAGALVTAGLRFHSGSVAADVGLGSVFDEFGYQGPLPSISGTVRF